ncbi:MAG: LLM class flavin-dependent oxidoreductase, partial [Variovorax sp.]
QRWLDGHALDGINIHIGHPAQFQRFVDEVLPILRERGVVREDYEQNTLRGNLGLPFAENRYTRARRAHHSAQPIQAPSTHPVSASA